MGNAYGNGDYLSRFLEPSTEHNGSTSSILTPVYDGGILFIRACELRNHVSPTLMVGSSGLVPLHEGPIPSGLFSSS